jgi:hypothetical protein
MPRDVAGLLLTAELISQPTSLRLSGPAQQLRRLALNFDMAMRFAKESSS